MKKNHCVPVLCASVIYPIESTGIVSIVVDCVVPVGNWILKLNPCKDFACDGSPVEILDQAGCSYVVYNRCADPAKINEVTIQASRHGRLHMTTSSELSGRILWQDLPPKTPTPVVSSTTPLVSSLQGKDTTQSLKS